MTKIVQIPGVVVIDTLRLSLKDYTITRGTPLQVQPAVIMPGTGEIAAGYGLFCFPDGERIEGARAFLNAPEFNLTIQPGQLGVSAFVQCSIPKVGTGDNYHPLSKEGTADALRRLQRLLKDSGVHTDVSQANVSRLDLFRTAVADHSFSSYARLFSILQGKRMKSRDYGTTFLWHNSQQEICIYDKIVEMGARGHNTTGLPANSIRFEHRLLKSRKVQSALGLKTCGDMMKHYDNLIDYYREKMQSTVFCYEPGDVCLLASKILETEMRWFKEAKGKQWLYSYLKNIGFRSLINESGKEVVCDAMRKVLLDGESGNTRYVKLHRLNRELAQAERDLTMISSGPTGGIRVLYEELRSKVLLQ